MAVLLANHRGSLETVIVDVGYIPALLDGSVTAATIPMIEGLAYLAAMGLTNAIDRTGRALCVNAAGTFKSRRRRPGWAGVNATTGWLVTSANQTTWESKVFICRYASRSHSGDHEQLCEWCGGPDSCQHADSGRAVCRVLRRA
jgi:hypothetical protein